MQELVYVFARSGRNAPKAQHIMARAKPGQTSSGALCGAEMIGWRIEFSDTPIEVMLCLRCANSRQIPDMMSDVPDPIEHIRIATLSKREKMLAKRAREQAAVKRAKEAAQKAAKKPARRAPRKKATVQG